MIILRVAAAVLCVFTPLDPYCASRLDPGEIYCLSALTVFTFSYSISVDVYDILFIYFILFIIMFII